MILRYITEFDIKRGKSQGARNEERNQARRINRIKLRFGSESDIHSRACGSTDLSLPQKEIQVSVPWIHPAGARLPRTKYLPSLLTQDSCAWL